MRRAQPQLPISPKVLKHFAAITIGLTALLALFANGEEGKLAAQVKAREAKNQLLAAEADKLGTRKLSSALALKKKSDPGPIYEIADPVAAPASVGTVVAYDASFQRKGKVGDFAPPPNLNGVPGGKMTVTGMELADTPDAARIKGLRQKKKSAFKPNEQQKSAIFEASRMRTGSVGVD